MQDLDTKPQLHLPEALTQAFGQLGCSATLIDRLTRPERIHQAELTIIRDNGDTLKLPAWRVQHSSLLGPYKGGIRFHPNVTLDEVATLSGLMTFKTALAGLPLGGGKGGVQVDAKTLSVTEREKLARAYIRQFHSVIGPNIDIPAPDVNTSAETMAWMMDEYFAVTGLHQPGVVTGKPVEIGGSLERDIATSLGGKLVLDKLIDHLEMKKRPLTVAVQGAGNVGGGLVQLLDAEPNKYKIIAIADTGGVAYSQTGLNVAEVMKHKAETGSVEHAEYTQSLTSDELFGLPVDILVLGALENQLTATNIHQVKAPLILELANHPITNEADAVLNQTSTVVVPDILANAGGVIVSYFEWAQNQQGYYWDADDVRAKLRRIIERTTDEVLKIASDRSVNLRVASYMLACRRLEAAARVRGVIH